MRKNLNNNEPTFLCPNCIGGILFHDLGLRFNSPTVNLMMLQTDFVKFILNLDQYLSQSLVFFKHPEYECPCATLGDITIHFTHYDNEEIAQKKWHERASRINRENMFIFLTERDGLSEDDIRALSKIKARGLVVFTANEYSDIPYTLQIPKYKYDHEIGNILAQSYLNGKREYENYFDFVKWFNEANDSNFDIKKFSLIK